MPVGGNSMPERRHDQRVSVKIEIQFREAGSFIRSYMLNVSNGGLFLKSENPLKLKTPVLLKVMLPGETEPMDIKGRVVWVNLRGRKNSFPRGMGIRFVSLLPDHARKIKLFVEKHLKAIQDQSMI